jgi:hypothetical protein
MTTWHNALKTTPLVAIIATTNDQESIYCCLDQAYKVFDRVFVLLDSSSDSTAKEVDKFIRRSHAKNVHVFDISRTDPWPNANVEQYAKRIAKSLQLVSSLIPDAICVSIDPSLIVNENAGQIIRNRASFWNKPEISCNFFTGTNKDGVKKVSSFSLWARGFVKPGFDTTSQSLRLYVQQGQEIFLITPVDVDELESIGMKNSD